jgi:hypothetical protein
MSETHLIEPLPLPPRRALPSDVRERMRRRVMAENHRPAGRRGALAVAAAVVLLAAGGVIVAQSAQDGGDTVLSPPTSTTTAVAPPPANDGRMHTGDGTDYDRRRCGFGDLVVTLPGTRIVISRSGGQVCELTHSRTSTRNLQPAPVRLDNMVGQLLRVSPTGTIVGQVWGDDTKLTVSAGLDPVHDVEHVFVDGYFVMRPSPSMQPLVVSTPTASAVIDVAGTVRGGRTITTDDFPGGTTDPVQQTLDRCLDGAMLDGFAWVGDPAAWRAGPQLGATLALTNGSRAAFCSTSDGNPPTLDWQAGDQNPFRSLYLVRSVRDSFDSYLLGGSVNPTVGKIEFFTPGGTVGETVLQDGLFLSNIGNVQPRSPGSDVLGIDVRVTDKSGTVIYEGPYGS